MANGIRTGNPRVLNDGRSLKFRVGSRVWQTPEEGRRIYRPKRCGNNNKDEDNSTKTVNDKKFQLQPKYVSTGFATEDFNFSLQLNFTVFRDCLR